MSRRLPPLNPLRAFEATARCGSVTAAAQELNVTHSAVSHQLRALETSINAKLFERGERSLRLTAQGAFLLPVVSGAFKDIAIATSEITRPATSGTLRISCAAGLLSLWLIPRLHRFAQQFPDITLSLRSGNDAAALQGNSADVSILYGDGRWPGYWSRLLSRLDLFPVISPTLQNSRPLRSIDDLKHHIILHGDDGHEWQTWFAAVDLPGRQIRRQMFLNDAQLSIEAAVHKQGVALGDMITAQNLIARGELIVPFEKSVPASDAFYVVCRDEARATPIMRIFVDWLFSEIHAGFDQMF